MKITTTLKSFYKLGNCKKSSKNQINHVKGILIFLLFSKTFFKYCKVSLLFFKPKTLNVTFLKAPSRHKKFFHETTFVKYTVKLTYNVFLGKFVKTRVVLPHVSQVNKTFVKLNQLFDVLGSNTLSKCKFKIAVSFNISLY